MNIKVDTNIPLPTDIAPKKGRAKYPFNLLKVGYSFAVPKKASKHFRQYVYNINSKTKKKFVCREVVEGSQPVFRVWRAA